LGLKNLLFPVNSGRDWFIESVPALHRHPEAEPGRQLGLVGAVSHVPVGAQVGAVARESRRSRQKLSAQGPEAQFLKQNSVPGHI
jgi:hypothetical protein